MFKVITHEPILAAIATLIGAAVALLAAFGVDFTAEQIAAIGAFTAGAVGVAAAVRHAVTPTAKAKRQAKAKSVS